MFMKGAVLNYGLFFYKKPMPTITPATKTFAMATPLTLYLNLLESLSKNYNLLEKKSPKKLLKRVWILLEIIFLVKES